MLNVSGDQDPTAGCQTLHGPAGQGVCHTRGQRGKLSKTYNKLWWNKLWIPIYVQKSLLVDTCMFIESSMHLRCMCWFGYFVIPVHVTVVWTYIHVYIKENLNMVRKKISSLIKSTCKFDGIFTLYCFEYNQWFL